MIFAAFFLSLSQSVCLAVRSSVPHSMLRETAPLWPPLPKQGKQGGKEAEQIREFLQKILQRLSTFMPLITDNNPLLLFKLVLIIAPRHVAPH